MYPDYSPQEIEAKWQQAWEAAGLYRAAETGDKPKFYCLDFFPYPSGEGLHVGHCRNYIPTDVISRFKCMQGYNVLHPMGWDAFGEPAEQYAVEHGVHPCRTTDQNTANFRRQMTLIGAGYDWSREIDSSRPEFYRWTQWFFTLLYRRGLAYRDTSWQWWCPTCQTTLSSHEVEGGVCWHGHPGSVHLQAWPAWDAVLAQDECLQIPVQVDGKVRQVIEMPLDASQDEVAELAFSHKKVQDHLKGRQILRIHYIPGKILRVVTRQSSRENGMSHDPLENQ